MHWLTFAFLAAVLAETLTRLWLASRQIAAVHAHRDRVPAPFAGQVSPAEHRKAADYTAVRARLGRIAIVVEAAIVLLLTLGGGIAAVDAAWQRAGWPQPWHGAAVVLSVFLLLAIVRLPFSLWRTFGLESRFGFNRMSLGLFAADFAKHLLLGLLIGTPLLLAVLTLMEQGGRWWWLLVWAVWLGFSLALTWAWPRFIAPLFDRFTPLEDEALRKSVEALLARCGFASKGVFVMNGSRKTAHGNAYFTGVGRNKRIVFFDTLLERLGAAEVEAVLAHELGHFRLRHIHWRLAVSTAMMLGGLAVLAWAARHPALYAALGVPVPSSHAALLLALLAAPAFTFFVTPLAAWWSRRHEYAADEFAARYASAGELAAALVKLYRDNATTLTPDRFHSAFYDSHPHPLARIARLRAQSS